MHPFIRFAPVCFLLCIFLSGPGAASGADRPDSKVKTWITAEMLGAMKWARAESSSSRDRLEFLAAEKICRDRLERQIEEGAITKASALVISENVRKKGVYRGENLTLARADELRRTIISGKIFQGLID